MFHLKFDTGNAAFDGEDRATEIARILRTLAFRLEHRGAIADGIEWSVRDINGNTIGQLNVSHREVDEDDDDPDYDDQGNLRAGAGHEGGEA